MSSQLLATIAERNSYYVLSNASPIPDSKIIDIISQALLTVPSAFNTQSTRAVVLLKADHEKLWEIGKGIMEAKLSVEQFKTTGAKFDGFRSGYGTVLFYEDPTHIAPMKEKFPSYASNFEPWAEQSNGMNQFAIWTALEAEGLGANLQHFNPLIDEKVAAQWNIPKEWRLRAQLVFGTPVGDKPGAKPKKPISELLFVHGA